MPKNLCGCRAALIELIAGVTDPNVAFLNPNGIDNPEAICRCVCDSVVRAPTADQQIKSAMYCGVIGSKSSVAVGTPRSMMSRRTRRAIRKPSGMSHDSSKCGSMMSPFQPSEVRGFSK